MRSEWLACPPRLYRKMVKPKQRRLLEAIKKKTDAKVFYHSCGASRDLIPDLIELGFDIVNPVQVSARGMDSRQLKRDFGADIVFWGGGVDTQHVLPFGTPDKSEMRSSAASTTWRPGGALSSPPCTTSRRLFRPRTSWPHLTLRCNADGY